MIIRKITMMIGACIIVLLFACWHFVEKKNPYNCISDIFGVALPEGCIVETSEIQYNYASFPDLTIKVKVRIAEDEYNTVLKQVCDLEEMIVVSELEEADKYIPPVFIDKLKEIPLTITDMFYCWETGHGKMTYYKYVVFTQELDGARCVYFWGM